MSIYKPNFIHENKKINKPFYADLQTRDLLKEKIQNQKNKLIREQTTKNKFTIIHSISSNQIYKGNHNIIPNPISSERKQINNINLNVNNLVINNTLNNLSLKKNNNNENKGFSKENKVFSKIGNDIMIKNINFSKPKYNNNNLNTIKKKKDGIENVLENLMEITKDKPLIFNIKRNSSNSNLESKINKQFKEKESQLIDDNDALIDIHFSIWECIFNMENHSENKNYLLNASKHFLNLINNEIQNKRKFEIFKLNNLNLVYQKIIKILIVLQVYIRFLLLDFNYEITIKSNVKKMISNINEYFLSLIMNFVFIKENLKDNNGCSKLNKDFINSFKLIIKNHKIKKTKEQPFIFSSSIYKNLDLAISTIRQFSNNFFKVGYFRPIHSICIEIFHLIDLSTLDEIFEMVNINILYYLSNYNPNKKKNNTENDDNKNNKDDKGKMNDIDILNKKINNINNDINANLDILSELGFLDIPSPFLPELEDNIRNKTYTLVLDLDETLVHFFYTPSGGSFLIRPYCFEFLEKMSKIFEIVIFTAAMKDYADNILDILDPYNNLIKYRLYRQHTSIQGINFFKDLSKLGRDLNKVIIIDNLSDNFNLQPNNGIPIITWTEDMKDSELLYIGNILENLILKNPLDVRIIIQKIKNDMSKKNNLFSFKNIDINNYL